MASRLLNLNDNEVAKIRSTWAPVTKDMKATGVLLANVMFELFPAYEDKFTMFKIKGQKTVRENPKFMKHIVDNVLGTVNKMIENLENDELVKSSLLQVGASHKKRNVTPNDFMNIVEIVMHTLRKGLGPSMTAEAETAWKKMLTNAMKQMAEGLK